MLSAESEQGVILIYSRHWCHSVCACWQQMV